MHNGASRRSSGTGSFALDHIPYLDGVRGFAAFWVFAGHVQIVSGMSPLPLLSYGRLAVDLFMMMSGILMAHHYLLRQQKEHWQSPQTWITFWIRRLFRIAPLYYLLLLVALAVGPTLGEYLDALKQFWPQIGIRPAHYTDRSLDNILAHLSFVFGAIPTFSHETPLPDWSIGLEMEFYAAFPFIMLLVGRIGAPITTAVLVCMCIVAELAFKDFFNQFEMPSLLPMKLYMFLAGILIATGRFRGSMRVPFGVSVVCGILYFFRENGAQAGCRIAMIIGVFYLLNDGSLPSCPIVDNLVGTLRELLGGRIGRLAGDASYAVYLLHFLVIIPVSLGLTSIPGFVQLHGVVRCLSCLVISVPIVYAVSWALHRCIEQPGIALGKIAVRHMSVSA